MPRIAILSDIHANWPAFSAVLLEIESRKDLDMLYFGGDVVGYGASPKRCIDFVRELGGICVMGNHEFYLNLISSGNIEVDEFDPSNPVEGGILHSFKELDDDDLEWCQELPLFMPIDEKTILVHASLEEPARWHYIANQDQADPTLNQMKKLDLELGFFGHVHKLAVYPEISPVKGNRYELDGNPPLAVTVGSVGQPRDKDPRASWVLFDSDERYFEFQRTEYDSKKAAQEILDAGLPKSSAQRLL